jgi:hypothetical protein
MSPTKPRTRNTRNTRIILRHPVFSEYLSPVLAKTKCIARSTGTAQRIDADRGKLYEEVIALVSGEKCMIST